MAVDSRERPPQKGRASEPRGDLLDNGYYRVFIRPGGILHVVRTAWRSDDLAEFIRASDRMLEVISADDVRDRPLLLDFRAAPPRNDPEFERAAAKYRQAFGRAERPIAYLLASAVGVLQMQRLARSVDATIATFLDEDQALAHLAAASKTSP